MKQIKKRDGRLVEFDKDKIINAILAAFKSVDGQIDEYAIVKAQNIADYIAKLVEERQLSVEEIQDYVEHGLMSTRRKDVAKAYILYREERTKERNKNSKLTKQMSQKLLGKNIENQNANIDEMSFGGRKGEATDIWMKQYALDNCMSQMSRNNHLNNEIYIHDLNSYACGFHNCVGRETEFLTTQGVKSFYDFEDGDKVEVLTHTGEIKKATVKNFGKQQLYKITLKKGNNICKIVRATKNHRWLLQNGEFTDELKVGDKMYDAPEIKNFDFNKATDNEKLMWCKGFGYRDGTVEYELDKNTGQYKKSNRVKIRLCNKKTKYAYRFAIDGCSISQHNDIYIYNYDKTIPIFNSYNELKAFVDGFYCASGYQTSHYGIQVTGEDYCYFIKEFFECCGYYISSYRDKTNYRKKANITIEYSFLDKPNKFKYTVKNITPDSIEDVWCLDVEDNHTFILSGGIVTGNCLSIPFDDLLAKGFNTRQTDVRPANSVSTAFQLLAVIFQLQSLEQFGGVAATHLDWTMVPYVRKSFYKHYRDGLKYIDNVKQKQEKVSPTDYSIEDTNFYNHAASYKYAMDMTKHELEQAVQGMYHNLKKYLGRFNSNIKNIAT